MENNKETKMLIGGIYRDDDNNIYILLKIDEGKKGIISGTVKDGNEYYVMYSFNLDNALNSNTEVNNFLHHSYNDCTLYDKDMFKPIVKKNINRNNYSYMGQIQNEKILLSMLAHAHNLLFHVMTGWSVSS